MNKNKDIKQNIHYQLQKIIGEKIETAKLLLTSAKESRDNDTKSTVGDKHETGRAMAQFEVEKFEIQLSKAIKLNKELSMINLQKDYKKVEFGSLVIGKHGAYFISIGIGKIEVDKKDYYCISIGSPIGKLLQDKKSGDKIEFQGRKIVIEEIV